jgi:hypothetical protein
VQGGFRRAALAPIIGPFFYRKAIHPMKKLSLFAAIGALLALSACASSDATVLHMSNVWSTTCGAGGQSVVISAKTLAEFHAAVENAPECAHGYTATAPASN